MIWFTADQHFSHHNVIGYTNRPFANVTEMDETLIKDWNDVVGFDDTVYHLGDFSLEGSEFASRIFRRLNGKINVLTYTWHHDKRWLYNAPTMSAYHDINYLEPLVVITPVVGSDKKKITLCHYPLEEWEASHYGAWCVHAHSHGTKDASRNRPILDVGVDNAFRLLGKYRPFSIDEISYIMIARS